jgi:hypothetical protein
MEFINEFSKKYSISTDLFLEIWMSEQTRNDININFSKNFTDHNSSLLELIVDTKFCLRHKKLLCPFPNIRTHMADPRQGVKLDPASYQNKIHKYTFEGLFTDILSFCFLEEIITSEIILSLKVNLKKLFPEFDQNDVLSLMERTLLNSFSSLDYFNEPIIQKYGRSYHEWIQLPVDIRKNLYDKARKIYTSTFYKDRNFRLISNAGGVNVINNFFNKLKNNEEFEFHNIFLNHNILQICAISSISIFIVDIYTVSRSLKSVKNGLPSELSIINLGNDHIENIMRLILDYYEFVEVYKQDWNIIKNGNRCLYKTGETIYRRPNVDKIEGKY